MSAVDVWLVIMVSDDTLPRCRCTATELKKHFVYHLLSSGSSDRVSFYRFSKELSPYIDKGITNIKSSSSVFQFDRVKLHASLVAANKMDTLS
jgi:adenine-specific DNA methylase